MNAIALFTLLGVLGTTQLQPQIRPGEGAVGFRAGYRYVPNPFFAEAAKDLDPVTSPYYGSPAVNLNCEYFALATVPVVLDVEWGGERLTLKSGGWIDTQAVSFGLSSGYQLDTDFLVKPYGIVGVDFVGVVVTDHIVTGSTVTGVTATFGLHAALGVMVPAFIPPWPWLAATAEVRYTFAPLNQRDLDYFILGIAATVGLSARFDVAASSL